MTVTRKAIATSVTSTATGDVAATNVQSAIAELASEKQRTHPRDLLYPTLFGSVAAQNKHSASDPLPDPTIPAALYLGAGNSGVASRLWFYIQTEYANLKACNDRIRIYTDLGDLPETDPGGGAAWIGDPKVAPDVDVPLALLVGAEYPAVNAETEPYLEIPAAHWETEFMEHYNQIGYGTSVQWHWPIWFSNGVLVQIWGDDDGLGFTPRRPGYFISHYELGTLTGPYADWRLRSTDHEDTLHGATADSMEFIDVADEGYLVAVYSACNSPQGMAFVESGFEFAVDNGTTVNWESDSYEDFFDNAYMFSNGRHVGRFSGTLAVGFSTGQSVAYRYFVRDALTFHNRLVGSYTNDSPTTNEDILLHVMTLYYSPSASS